MSAISATRRQAKEMADGTIRVSIDIDPQFKAQFHALFPDIDMPVAIAPLVADFERKQEEQNPIPIKAAICGGGALAKWAGILSNDPKFWEWLELIEGAPVVNANQAAEHIRLLCGVASRADLDHDAEAGRRFREEFMAPFDEWTKSL
ncbi:MAG: hypothetical protein ACYC4K_06120 [Thiobacillus sp.]